MPGLQFNLALRYIMNRNIRTWSITAPHFTLKTSFNGVEQKYLANNVWQSFKINGKILFCIVQCNSIIQNKKSWFSLFIKKLRHLTIINLQRGSMPSILDCIEVIRLTGPKWISWELRLNNEDSEEIYLLFSCLLSGRIYPFFDTRKELPLKLQKIPNLFSHPHSVKITREYSHTYRINLSIFCLWFSCSQYSVLRQT